ncbi:MAG TPA: CDP-2,3-bis-(O-geranylgeranyl)-sn-glycerol synthase [Candidatus Korarchaeota archaeon]|nr:CDP-2,3-bis-(O-geranylgeranyl)-sn-glycerol synthase [Candidatus Korarchaeota archaeon]
MASITVLKEALWFVLPAYFANASPVIFGGGAPIDCGRTWRDGRPIFGSNKTIRGFAAGILVGTLVGILQGRPLSGFLLALGAMIGDLTGSFLKRRLGLKPGQQAPILDQLGFLLFALVLTLPVERPSTNVVLAAVLITPLAHVASNAVAVVLGLKRGL